AEKSAFTLSGTLLTFWNRRMRTRMYGGVRGRGLAAPSYLILHSYSGSNCGIRLAGRENPIRGLYLS
ncbi:hypothetical protein, partial [Paenibacillus pseudetheri]|uniref:hypothetical protein n=1 Tax=Paenibacillus pseudetheri TaxID=2897682 RepID=UPI001F42D9FA